MKKICVVACLAVISGTVFAQAACERISGRVGAADFRSNAGDVRYTLASNDRSWTLQGYGWHATAAVICQTCANPDSSWGLVDLTDRAKTAGSGLSEMLGGGRVATATQRAKRAREDVYYPIRTLGPDKLTPVYWTDDARIGQFSGHAVAFEFNKSAEPAFPDTVDGVIGFSVTDGCAHLSGTVVVQLGNARHRVASLLAALQISRGAVR